jgi:hypothetical protein
VGIGVVVAVLVAAALGFGAVALAPSFGSIAPIFGVAAGGFLAGKRAKHHTLYHGALAAAGYVVLEGIGVVPTPFPPAENALADSIAIILSDGTLLAIGALAGWLARPEGPSSSSGMDRAR